VLLEVACRIDSLFCVFTYSFLKKIDRNSLQSYKKIFNGIARKEGTSNHEQKAVLKLRQLTKMQGCKIKQNKNENRVVASNKQGET
jgi:hypothetical protein